MNSLTFIALLCISIFVACSAQVFYLTAPSTLCLDSEETIAIAVEGQNNALVSVYIQDHPGKIKNISQAVFTVHPGTPVIFKVNLNPADFPPNFFTTNPSSEKLVSLTVHSQQFHKEIQIPISNNAGYVFIQTDKPIYTPKQRVHIRVIPLNEDALPSNKSLKLQIKNPQNIIVKEKTFDALRKVFITDMYDFPTYPVLGVWSVVVNYGYKLEQNATVSFELKEYVLPTFTVDLKAPNIVLETDEFIIATVHANYVYGKKVDGLVTFRLGVKGEAPNAIYFTVIGPKKLVDGSYTLRLETKSLSRHKDIGWFPEIEGSHLVIEATVVDAATGNKEIAKDARTRFTKTPFEISFKRCLQDFRPGLVSTFEADINYIDGRPASGISTVLKAVANGDELKITEINPISDEEGKVSFEMQPEIQHEIISITLETNDPRYFGKQAVGHYTQRKFQSKNKAYIAIDRSSAQKLKVDDVFLKVVHFEPAEIQNSYYTVSSKGKIILQKSLEQGQFKLQRIEFKISHDMVPGFRITVFAHYRDELLVDSLNIDIEATCNPSAKVSLEPDFGEPGTNGKIVIHGTKATLVGLLGVDEAVYALNKKDLLTRSKVFKTLAKHDLGCGPGGGITTDIVMANAGLLIASNIHTPSYAASSCVENKRRKRELGSQILQNYTGLSKECCSLGMNHDGQNRDCETRTNIVNRHLQGERQECSRAFLECCLKAKEDGFFGMKLGRNGGPYLARSSVPVYDEPNFIPLEEEDFFEKGLTVRNDFRETWFVEDKLIGPDNKEVFDVSLPHSITTWMIQAVSVSPNHGICIAEPQKITATKKVFLQLNLPYSVVRNEQIEIQATLFNYGDSKLSAVLYMYGVKDLCTGANEGEKSERRRITVDKQSAKSVAFPVIPLKEGQFNLKVVALSPEGSDIIMRKLNVVPEGYPIEVDIPVKLDPTNQQRRKRRHITTEQISDSIDPTQKKQVTAIKLPVPKDFVPGTESCVITAIGDQMGNTVSTAINNPDSLITMPGGCGEQNMVRFAPTIYTMRYLKHAAKITPELEEKGYEFIRKGYENQLSFRKSDGSYAAWQSTPTSLWLTAFVMKVFCQANELIHIDENVICSGTKYLVSQQQPDGSYIENNPIYHIEMVGGVKGKTPLTAYVLTALEECECEVEDLHITKKRAVSYLEEHLGEVDKSLPLAVVAYALSLSESDLKEAANDRLLSMAKYDEDRNLMHWESENTAQDIEATGYALLNQVLFNDLTRGSSIVNWLNTQQLQSGVWKSTQDTIVALQALSEYAIRAKMPAINLVVNISSSNDRNFNTVLNFNERNAQILQDVKVKKIGGMLFVNTGGNGVGSLSVKLRYNVLNPSDKMCKFDVTVNATEMKKEIGRIPLDLVPKSDVFDMYPPDLIRGINNALEVKEDVPVIDVDPRNRGQFQSLVAVPNIVKDNIRVKREEDKLEISKLMLKISVCARYLGTESVGMSIVDVGIFSGFEPNIDDLKMLQEDPASLIERFEKSSKGIVFYLKTIPSKESYCFHFHVIREYIVGKTQMSVVKVYDYYNPDEACTVFYSPGTNSPLLKTLCNGGVCQCAEGGCPPQNPFDELKKYPVAEKADKLIEMACDKYDFVWKGKLDGEIEKKNGFFNISFKIEEVIKEGIEKAGLVEEESRYFLARDNCDTASLFPDQTYLIMGIDGLKYKNEAGEIWHRYLLDKKSAIHLWTDIRRAKDKDLQRILSRATKKLKKEGCSQ